MMYTFGDDSSPVRPNQKHRRSRGYLPRRKSNNPAASIRNGAASSQNVHGHPVNSNSYQQGEQNYSSAAAGANPPQATYYSAEGWGDAPISSGNNNNDETGSLNYSTSSSVQSAESSSNSSSFADILKQIDSDIDLKDYSDPEIKDLMAKQSKATNDQARLGQAQYSKMRGMGMEMSSSAPPPAAVAGWIQRREQQQQQQKQYQYHTQREAHMQMQQAQRKQQHQYNNYMSAGPRQQQYANSGHVDWNYSRDSSEGDIDGVNFSEQEEYVLETIAGKRDVDGNVNRLANITINTVRPQAAQSPGDVFRGRDLLGQQRDPHRSRSDSPASRGRAAPRVATGHVTPPPNARGKRTSAAPPGSAGSISRTSSRHSKSSSDGSFDTPAPSSPPHGGGAHSSKPPHARSSPSKTRRKGGGEKEDNVVEIGSYQNPWFCGFADSLDLVGAFR